MNGTWGTRHIGRNTEELWNTDYPTHSFHKGMWLPCLFYKVSNIPISSYSGLSSHVLPLGCLGVFAFSPPLASVFTEFLRDCECVMYTNQGHHLATENIQQVPLSTCVCQQVAAEAYSPASAD